MYYIDIFETVPISVIYIGTVLFILLAFEIGYQIGKFKKARYDTPSHNAMGPMVAGFLAMLAFVLAFTFNMASTRHDLRKQRVLDEANVIGTAYLRTDLVAEPFRTELKKNLREYVNVRISKQGKMNVDDIIARSIALHKLLWASVVSATENNLDQGAGLLIRSINGVIDMHEDRVMAAVYNRIPFSVWMVVYIISALAMLTMGAQAGLTRSRRLIAIIPLTLAFAALITLVVDLDHPQRGMIKVSQQALIDLQNSINVSK
ncbi:hypothetical protein ACFLQL_02640 [Verrucomicrobiota bacterium]